MHNAFSDALKMHYNRNTQPLMNYTSRTSSELHPGAFVFRRLFKSLSLQRDDFVRVVTAAKFSASATLTKRCLAALADTSSQLKG